MKNTLAVAILLISLAQFISLPAFSQPAAINVMPESKLVLGGLTTVSVRATSTEDARRALKSIGQNAGSIEASMIDLARERLRDIGLNVDGGGASTGAAELLLTIYTDLRSGTVKLDLSLNELVSPVRTADTRFMITTWQRSANPRSNEAKPMTQTAGMLVEQFIADYLEANPRGKR